MKLRHDARMLWRLKLRGLQVDPHQLRAATGPLMRMGDAVTPGNLPGGLDAYAGYANGLYTNIGTIAAQHQGARILPITVRLADLGDCMDIEQGDAVPGQGPTYVRWRQPQVSRPCLYASISVMPEVVGFLAGAGIPRTAYRLWSAHYTYAHICGPTTCRYNGAGTPQCDGTQWTDHGGVWDESLLYGDFFGAAPAPPPPPPDHSAELLALGVI